MVDGSSTKLIKVFAINPDNGHLTYVASSNYSARNVHSLVISLDSQFAYVDSPSKGVLTKETINPETGALLNMMTINTPTNIEGGSMVIDPNGGHIFGSTLQGTEAYTLAGNGSVTKLETTS